MTDLKIVTNADSGTADIVGGNDWDDMAGKVNRYMNSYDPYNYHIYKTGTTFYAKNGLTKVIDSSNSSADVVIQAAMDQLTGNGGVISLAPNTEFVLNTPLVLPQSDNTNNNQYRIFGYGSGWFQQTNTTLSPSNDSGTWTGRAMIECKPSIGGAKRSALRMRGVSFYNPYFTTFNVGGIDLRNDTNTRFGHIVLEDLGFRYIGRGINIQGYAYHAIMRDFNFTDANSSFAGEYCMKIEQGGYPDKPDFLYVDNVHTSFIGSQTNEFYIESNYSNFSNFHTDGWTYTECPFKIVNSNANLFHMIGGTDLNGASGTATTALYLTCTGSGTTRGNKFTKLLMAAYPPSGTRRTVLIDHANCTNNYIELEHFGSNDIRIDETAGDQNVFALMPGFHSGFTQAKPIITTIQATSRVIDFRGAAVTRGTATKSGDGVTTAFTIAHGCYAAPSYFYVMPTSGDARSNHILSADATNITVTYASHLPPPSGSSNLTFVWEAVV